MTDTHTHTSPESTFPFLINTGEFAALGRKRMGDLMRVQTEFLDELQESNRHWFDRIQSEANLASEFASKLTLARSMPDAMALSRDWATQYFAMLAEDGKHLADDTRKFIERGARLFSGGLSAQEPTANS